VELNDRTAAAVARLWLDGFEDHVVDADDPAGATFGRSGDLIVDEGNPFMSRCLGRVRLSAGAWRLSHEGKQPDRIQLRKPGSRWDSLGVDSETRLPAGVTTVSFDAGPGSYRVCIEVPVGGIDEAAPVDDRETTMFPMKRVSPTPMQRKVLIAMCEPELLGRGGGSSPLVPSDTQLAKRVGIAPRTIEKHVTDLIRQFAEADAGVDPSAAPRHLPRVPLRWKRPADRRALMVRSALDVGLITARDLDLLDS